MADKGCLILFARAPMPGAVKTRLAAQLGEPRTLALYRKMLRRQIKLVNGFDDVHAQLWVDGNIGHPDFAPFGGRIFRQEGADIGQRMGYALQHALSEHAAAVLIGCDCPGIDAAYLGRAFAALSDGHDAVLGPATDGGYILIGLRRWETSLFEGPDWGTGQVLAQTRARLSACGFRWKELDPLADIDGPEDLAAQAALIEREYGDYPE